MTKHRIITGDSKDVKQIADKSVHLIVTSPPYPMISMWDDVFSRQDPDIGRLLEAGEGLKAFTGCTGF